MCKEGYAWKEHSYVTGQGVEQCGLAATGGAHDGQHLAGARAAADAVQDGGRLPPAVDRRHPHVLPRYEHAAVAADVLRPAVTMIVSSDTIKPSMVTTAASTRRSGLDGGWCRRRRCLPRESGAST